MWRRARAGIGYVPQGPSVLWDLSVEDNLATFQKIVHANVGGVAERAQAVGLEHCLGVRAGDLSAGERRRLEFARAITREPRLLICDEPFAAIDPVGAERLGELLVGLARRGVAVMLADHHVAEALRVCTRAILLLDGAVAAEADPAHFAEHPLVRGRYLGTLFPAAPAHIVPAPDLEKARRPSSS
jgi:lipopolysaccharide export system ATP-binding protein